MLGSNFHTYHLKLIDNFFFKNYLPIQLPSLKLKNKSETDKKISLPYIVDTR